MPEGSSSAAPVTSPGPSNRSTRFRGFLGSERIVSVMKIFDGLGSAESFEPWEETFCLNHSAGKEFVQTQPRHWPQVPLTAAWWSGFDIRYSPAAGSRSECQIQNSTRNL